MFIRGVVEEGKHSQPPLRAESNQVQDKEVIIVLCHCDNKPTQHSWLKLLRQCRTHESAGRMPWQGHCRPTVW